MVPLLGQREAGTGLCRRRGADVPGAGQRGGRPAGPGGGAVYQTLRQSEHRTQGADERGHIGVQKPAEFEHCHPGHTA